MQETSDCQPPRVYTADAFYSSQVIYSYFTGAGHKARSWPRLRADESGVPLAIPSHFLLDRKPGAVFLSKFGFGTGET